MEEPTNGVLLANPFRYRGYYYDSSIGLYYLNSRYYDPETGRFLNEDLVSYLEPETIGGINLYAYCLNDPVNNIDPSGHFVMQHNMSRLIHMRSIMAKSDLSWFAGHVNSISKSQEIYLLSLGVLSFSYAISAFEADRDKSFLYSYSDLNGTLSSYGIGANVRGWFGIQLGLSVGFSDWRFLLTGRNSPFDFTSSVQLTPWITFNASIGLGGLGLGISFQNENTSHDFSIHIPLTGIAGMILAYFGGIIFPILLPGFSS